MNNHGRLSRALCCWLLVVLGAAFAAHASPLWGAAAGNVFTLQRAEAALKRHVLANSLWKVEDVELRVVNFTPLALPQGTLSIRVLRPTNSVTPGPSSFLLALDIGGKEHSRLWLKAEIRVFEDVVVSSTHLANRELVQAKDLRLERREVSSLQGRPFLRIEDVAGKQAIRGIEVNEVLTQKSVDSPMLMRRGTPLTLVYETGNLRVESPGLAVEGGKIGEAIQVKNPSSGKLLRGVVIDARTVKVN